MPVRVLTHGNVPENWVLTSSDVHEYIAWKTVIDEIRGTPQPAAVDDGTSGASDTNGTDAGQEPGGTA